MCHAAVGYAHQAAELAYSVVYMYYVVANAELFQFLDGECCLAVACTFAAQAEIVEAPEELMVGEKGDF